jgi:putative tricarboxylic transport membrane protein
VIRPGHAGGVAAAAFGVAYLGVGLSMPAAALGDPLGAKAFPLVLGGLMTALGLSLALVPVHEGGGSPEGGLVRFKTMATLTGLLGLYGYSLPYAGYPLGTFLFLLVTARLLGERSWRLGVLLSAGLSLAVYLLFTRLLDVPLPLGVLDPSRD